MSNIVEYTKTNYALLFNSILTNYHSGKLTKTDLELLKIIYAPKFVNILDAYELLKRYQLNSNQKPYDFDYYLRRIRVMEKQLIIKRFAIGIPEKHIEHFKKLEDKLSRSWKTQCKKDEYKKAKEKYFKVATKINKKTHLQCWRGAEDLIKFHTKFNDFKVLDINIEEVLSANIATKFSMILDSAAHKFNLFESDLKLYETDHDVGLFILDITRASNFETQEALNKIERLFDKGKALNYYKEHFMPRIFVFCNDNNLSTVKSSLEYSIFQDIVNISSDGENFYKYESESREYVIMFGLKDKRKYVTEKYNEMEEKYNESIK